MNRAEPTVLYWRPGCPYCTWLRRALRGRKLAFTEIDIWSHPEAAAFVRSVADGNETVPTVTVAGHPLVNPSASQVMAAVAEHASHLLPAACLTASWWHLLLQAVGGRARP